MKKKKPQSGWCNSHGSISSPPRSSSARPDSSSRSPVWIPGYISSPAWEEKGTDGLAELHAQSVRNHCDRDGLRTRCVNWLLDLFWITCCCERPSGAGLRTDSTLKQSTSIKSSDSSSSKQVDFLSV